MATFTFNYGIIALVGGIGLGWKIIKRTKFRHAKDVNLISGLQFFEASTEYYQTEREAAPESLKDRIMAKVF